MNKTENETAPRLRCTSDSKKLFRKSVAKYRAEMVVAGKVVDHEPAEWRISGSVWGHTSQEIQRSQARADQARLVRDFRNSF